MLQFTKILNKAFKDYCEESEGYPLTAVFDTAVDHNESYIGSLISATAAFPYSVAEALKEIQFAKENPNGLREFYENNQGLYSVINDKTGQDKLKELDNALYDKDKETWHGLHALVDFVNVNWPNGIVYPSLQGYVAAAADAHDMDRYGAEYVLLNAINYTLYKRVRNLC